MAKEIDLFADSPMSNILNSDNEGAPVDPSGITPVIAEAPIMTDARVGIDEPGRIEALINSGQFNTPEQIAAGFENGSITLEELRALGVRTPGGVEAILDNIESDELRTAVQQHLAQTQEQTIEEQRAAQIEADKIEHDKEAAKELEEFEELAEREEEMEIAEDELTPIAELEAIEYGAHEHKHGHGGNEEGGPGPSGVGPMGQGDNSIGAVNEATAHLVHTKNATDGAKDVGDVQEAMAKSSVGTDTGTPAETPKVAASTEPAAEPEKSAEPEKEHAHHAGFGVLLSAAGINKGDMPKYNVVDISPAGKIPPEHGAGLTAIAGLPNKGPAAGVGTGVA